MIRTPLLAQQDFAGTLTGSAYRLGAEVGSGGEGIIHAVVRRPELLAKVYRRPPSRYEIDKLDALVRAATPDLLSVAAWPTDSLKNPSGLVIGFVMPRVLDARALYDLYGPRSRVQHFPSADFRFLVHVAGNIARLFGTVHAAGFIIGDVNHGNILVRNDGTVAAVDCDSLQIGDGSRFPCRVGTDLFVPPELLGKNFDSVRRTPNHDAFGLAVLIFHLLFMGRHPFAGRYLGLGEMPIEKAIAECRFAYARDGNRTKMAPPPFTVPMTAIGPATGELFERAFHPDGRKHGRPTPQDWIRVLDALNASLSTCASVPWHQYPPSLRSCPWCEIETAARVKLFGGLMRVASAGLGELDMLWARYTRIADPGPPKALPRDQDWAPPGSRRLNRRVVRRLLGSATAVTSFAAAGLCAATNPMAAAVVLIVGAVAVVAILLGLCVPRTARAQALDAFACADNAWQAVAQAWRAIPPVVDFTQPRQAIEALKAKLDGLAPERAARLITLAKPVSEAEQRARYLGQFRIEGAGLYNIGAARAAVLRSWGIDTAADIHDAKISEIPGFGRNLTDRLVNWRDGLERKFTFEPLAVTDPLDVQKIDRELAARRTRLMKELRSAIAGLEKQIACIRDERTDQLKRLEAAFNARMLARRQVQF